MTGIAKSAVEFDAYPIGNLTTNSLAWTSFREELNSDPRGCDMAKFNWQTTADNVWRTLFTGFNDSRGYLDIWGSDTASMDRKRFSFAITTPGYGVSDWDQEMYFDGGWNTGAFEVQVLTVGTNFDLRFRYSSFYSSTNTGTFYAHWRGVYA